MGDDEYDVRKWKAGEEMKKRLGLDINPLDGTVARVGPYTIICPCPDSIPFFLDEQGAVHVPILHQGSLNAVPHSR